MLQLFFILCSLALALADSCVVFYAFTGEIKDANITVAGGDELEPVTVQIVAVDTHLLSPSSWHTSSANTIGSTSSKTNLTLAQQASLVTNELSLLNYKLAAASDKKPTWLIAVGKSSIYSSQHGDNTELASYLQPLLQTHKPSVYFSLHNRNNEHMRMYGIDEFAAAKKLDDSGSGGGGGGAWQSSSSSSSSSQAVLVWPQQPSNATSTAYNSSTAAARFAAALSTMSMITITANHTSLVVRLVEDVGNDKEVYTYTLTRPFTSSKNNNNNDDDEHKQQVYTFASRSTLAKTLISLAVFAVSVLATALVQLVRGEGEVAEKGEGEGEGEGEEGAIQDQHRHKKQQHRADEGIANASPFSSLLEAAYRGSGISSSSCFGSSSSSSISSSSSSGKYDGLLSPPKKASTKVLFSLLKPRSVGDIDKQQQQQQQNQNQHTRQHSSFSSASIFTSIASLREYVLQNDDDEPFSSNHSTYARLSHQRRSSHGGGGAGEGGGGGEGEDDSQARCSLNRL